MTALLQVCGTLDERGALPTARAIAGRNSAPVLRASAIAAVGMLGDASDLPLLRRLGGHARLQACFGGHGQDTEIALMKP